MRDKYRLPVNYFAKLTCEEANNYTVMLDDCPEFMEYERLLDERAVLIASNHDGRYTDRLFEMSVRLRVLERELFVFAADWYEDFIRPKMMAAELKGGE